MRFSVNCVIVLLFYVPIAMQNPLGTEHWLMQLCPQQLCITCHHTVSPLNSYLCKFTPALPLHVKTRGVFLQFGIKLDLFLTQVTFPLDFIQPPLEPLRHSVSV